MHHGEYRIISTKGVGKCVTGDWGAPTYEDTLQLMHHYYRTLYWRGGGMMHHVETVILVVIASRLHCNYGK
jgi:hypothetical protein